MRLPLWIVLLILFSGLACSHAGKYISLVAVPPPSRSYPCDITIFRNEMPKQEFVEISRIDVHVERTFYVRSNFDDVVEAIKEQGCLSGADAVIKLEEKNLTMNLNESHIYHVTGIGIQYKNNKFNEVK